MSLPPHAFVLMPSGRRTGDGGTPIDFDRIHTQLIRPALEQAGYETFRAEEGKPADELRDAIVQELLLADLVVVDLTIDSPEVWYPLGVRHALRARGVLLISSGRLPPAPERGSDPGLRYGLHRGRPDPTTLRSDIEALSSMARALRESRQGPFSSPVYVLLPHLREPPWTSLRMPEARAYWQRHEAWRQRMDHARRAGRLGDMLLLAGETPVAACRAEAWIAAGHALRCAEQFRLALEQFEQALALEPGNRRGLLEKGLCLGRLASAGAPDHGPAQARDHVRRLLAVHPKDAEICSLAGQVEMDAWTARWRRPGRTADQRRRAAADAAELLFTAVERYAAGFRAEPGHYPSGLHALTLMHLARHLTADPSRDEAMRLIEGGVRFAAAAEQDPSRLCGARATLAILEILEGPLEAIRLACRKVIDCSESNASALESSRSLLLLLQDLGFRPEAVRTGIELVDAVLAEATATTAPAPRSGQVILFSGHMMDRPERPRPRFPPSMEPAAGERIAAALDAFGVGEEDIAFSQAAAGGDLLFLEACQRRQVPCQVLLPLEEEAFLQRSVLPSWHGKQWLQRYRAVREKLSLPLRQMPLELGATPAHVNAYERCNLWLLNSALACGIERLRFITLWNGSGGDGPGGTAHLYHEVQRHTGRICWIDTRSLPCG